MPKLQIEWYRWKKICVASFLKRWVDTASWWSDAPSCRRYSRRTTWCWMTRGKGWGILLPRSCWWGAPQPQRPPARRTAAHPETRDPPWFATYIWCCVSVNNCVYILWWTNMWLSFPTPTPTSTTTNTYRNGKIQRCRRYSCCEVSTLNLNLTSEVSIRIWYGDEKTLLTSATIESFVRTVNTVTFSPVFGCTMMEILPVIPIGIPEGCCY